jgi:hypothetical protein
VAIWIHKTQIIDLQQAQLSPRESQEDHACVAQAHVRALVSGSTSGILRM